MLNDRIPEYFRAALKYFLEKRGRGAQSWLSEQSGVNPQFISQILSGKKRGLEGTRRRLVAPFGMSYERFLNVGIAIIQKEPMPPEHPGDLLEVFQDKKRAYRLIIELSGIERQSPKRFRHVCRLVHDLAPDPDKK